jgi:putative antitoxin of VapBC-like toxin-antitoxin system
MRTTFDIDRTLLERARAALGVATYREAVVRSLEEAIHRADVLKILDGIEASDLTWDLAELLTYRRQSSGHTA